MTFSPFSTDPSANDEDAAEKRRRLHPAIDVDALDTDSDTNRPDLDAFRVSRPVGRAGHSPGDVRKLRRALNVTGHMRSPRNPGGQFDRNAHTALTKFQKDWGLKPDALINPGGRTESAVNVALAADRAGGQPAQDAARKTFAALNDAGFTFAREKEEASAPAGSSNAPVWRDRAGNPVPGETLLRIARQSLAKTTPDNASGEERNVIASEGPETDTAAFQILPWLIRILLAGGKAAGKEATKRGGKEAAEEAAERAAREAQKRAARQAAEAAATAPDKLTPNAPAAGALLRGAQEAGKGIPPNDPDDEDNERSKSGARSERSMPDPDFEKKTRTPPFPADPQLSDEETGNRETFPIQEREPLILKGAEPVPGLPGLFIFPDMSDEIDRFLILENRRGNNATKAHMDTVRDQFLAHYPGFKLVAGGRDPVTGDELPEEYIPNPAKRIGKKLGIEVDGRIGSKWPDMKFVKETPEGEVVIYIQTVDGDKNGKPTKRELDNAEIIRKWTNATVLLVVKGT